MKRGIQGLTLLAAAGLLSFAAPGAAAAQKSLNDLTGPWILFVDDHAVAEKADVVRTYHPFEKYAGNPVLVADRPWEERMVATTPGQVLPREDGSGFRIWYPIHTPKIEGVEKQGATCYAESEDGVHWVKPSLGLFPWPPNGEDKANNIIRGGKSVMHLPQNPPEKRYLDIHANNDHISWSADGLDWYTEDAHLPKGGDVSRFMWDPNTEQFHGFVKIIRNVSGLRRRCVGHSMSTDPVKWPDLDLVLAPDDADDCWTKRGSVARTHFYGLSTFAYESMYIGILWIFQAYDPDGYFYGPNYCEIVTSHDNVRWFRQETPRKPMLNVGMPGEWDDGQLYSSPTPAIKGDKLYLFYGGSDEEHCSTKKTMTMSLGMSTLRKDGFASLDAGTDGGTVTTKQLVGAKGTLHVNVDANGGQLLVEVLDAQGNVVPGYAANNCRPVICDGADLEVTWGGRDTLPEIDEPIRLRFILADAKLYSFNAGRKVTILEDVDNTPMLGVLCTFEENYARRVDDKLDHDGKQTIHYFSNNKIDRDAKHAAFGEHSLPLGSEFGPRIALELAGTSKLGTNFTLALNARFARHQLSRLFSSADDQGPVMTSELVFDCDPNGHTIPGMRLIAKGIEIVSEKLSFADDKYHHLAVTYDDGLIRFYLDGKPTGQGNVYPGSPIDMCRDLFVGEDTAHGRDEQLWGNVDDVLVLGRTLSDAEIAKLARDGADASRPWLIEGLDK